MEMWLAGLIRFDYCFALGGCQSVSPLPYPPVGNKRLFVREGERKRVSVVVHDTPVPYYSKTVSFEIGWMGYKMAQPSSPEEGRKELENLIQFGKH